MGLSQKDNHFWQKNIRNISFVIKAILTSVIWQKDTHLRQKSIHFWQKNIRNMSLVIEAIFTFNFSINWGVFVIFVLPTKDKRSYYIRSTVQINSLLYKLTKTKLLANTSTHQLINLSTHQLTNSSTHQLTNSKTHQLTNSSTYKLINL